MFDAKNFDNSDNGGDAINMNNQWAYPLQYIWESEEARRAYNCLLFRTKRAIMGKPSKNLYQEEMKSVIASIDDVQKKTELGKACVSLPEGTSRIFKKAKKNIANQVCGGVDTYDYQIDDPYGIIKDDTEDLLAAMCEHDYITNNLERKSETISSDLLIAGISAMLVDYCPTTGQNIIKRINPKNIFFDTKYSSTGEERFRGYATMISWRKLKEMIKNDGDEVNLTIKAPSVSIIENGEIRKGAKYGNRKIRTLNGLDVYVHDLNQLAVSSQLQGNLGLEYDEYSHDLNGCYNLGYYRSLASTPQARTNNGYESDDVELIELYDLVNRIKFRIINRRYVISANSECFHRKIVFNIEDPRGGLHQTIDDFYLDCPLKFVWAEDDEKDMMPYPHSTMMTLCDDFDILCAWRAKREHVAKILSILRIETNGADAASLKGVLNIMGIVLDDIQGDINSIEFTYNYEHIDTQIAYYEETIKTTLSAYDQFDALQAMGDRASAAESGMALSAVAQGLSTHQNAMMQMYAQIARQCIANRVAYSDQQVFPIVNKGKYRTIDLQEMALAATITVKPKLAKKIEQKLLSANALTMIGNLKDILTPEGLAGLAEIALMGIVPKAVAKTYIKEAGPSEAEMAVAAQQGQNDANIIAQNQQAYQQNPNPYEISNVMNSLSPDEIDAVVAGMAEDQGLNSLSDLDKGMERERNSIMELSNVSPEMGGTVANEDLGVGM